MTISNYYVREYLHLFTLLLMIGSLSSLAVLAKSSVNLIIRLISDFSIRVIYQADGLGVNC